MAITFTYNDLHGEFVSMVKLATSFLRRGDDERLRRAADALAIIRASRRRGTWEIPEADPVWTKPNEGKHEFSGKGRNIQARIDFIWDVLPSRVGNRDRLEIVGQASARVLFVDADTGAPLAQWHMDAGDPAQPGAQFHFQAEWPDGLPIPRVPLLVPSPATVVEFVIAELFNEEWRFHASRNSAARARVRSVQRGWMKRLSDDQLRRLDESGESPVTFLRQYRSDSDIFV